MFGKFQRWGGHASTHIPYRQPPPQILAENLERPEISENSCLDNWNDLANRQKHIL